MPYLVQTDAEMERATRSTQAKAPAPRLPRLLIDSDQRPSTAAQHGARCCSW
jgi:hypothetical protein